MRAWIVGVEVAGVAALGGCDALNSLVDTDTRQTFPAVWVHASWSGGRTGTPLESKGVFPANYFGAVCPANSVVLENHTTKYAAFPFGDILLLSNTCGNIIWVAVCRTSGSGGVASPSIPTCSPDPRDTPGDHFNIQRLSGAGGPYPFGNTPINLDVEVFWCGTGSDFNFSVSKPRSGAKATDCVEVN
ncbi:MAG: hypothetical protein U9Q74_08085 [Gemmatimonadota bacterium]|nr:hypothetical protein [Gemmatimonadota bacterium]